MVKRFKVVKIFNTTKKGGGGGQLCLLIPIFFIRALFFQLSFGHNGQLLCRAN
jgi:hypothetical protein